MATDAKTTKGGEKRFSVTEVDFRGWYRRNYRCDRVTPPATDGQTGPPTSPTVNYEFTQDIVFGFGFLIKLPEEKKAAPEAKAPPTSAASAASAAFSGVRGLDDDEDDDDDDEEKEKDEQNQIAEKDEERRVGEEKDTEAVVLSKSERRLRAGRLSKEAERLVEAFLRNIKFIKLRYLNIPDRPADDSAPFFSCLDALPLEIIKHRRLMRQSPTHVLIRVSELFFDPNYPLLPRITSAGLYFTVDFHEPCHWQLAISCLDIDPARIYENVPKSKYGEQQLFLTELAKSKHNIAIGWHVSFTQPLSMYSSEEHPLANMNEITIKQPFEGNTDSILISLEDARNDDEGRFVLHELQSVTVKHNGVTRRYLPNSYRKAENCYLNGFKLSFQKRMMTKAALDELLIIKHLTALTMEYVDSFDAKDLMQFLIHPNAREKNGGGGRRFQEDQKVRALWQRNWYSAVIRKVNRNGTYAVTFFDGAKNDNMPEDQIVERSEAKTEAVGSSSVTFRFYKVVRSLTVRILKVQSATVKYRPKVDSTWTVYKDGERLVTQRVAPDQHPFLVLHSFEKDAASAVTKVYHVYRPLTRCHLIK